jgi:NADH:ubiquinone oxidoreductase subunit 6 (subunit J)
MSPAFLVIALVTLASAAVAMTLRNLIHSALLLVASWAGIAAFYLWAGAQFVAFAQVLVYVGAVSMIVLFAVLLTRQSRADLAVAPDSLGRALAALLVGGAVLGVLLGAIMSSPLESAAMTAPTVKVREIGTALMGPAAGALLIAGILLTVALLGAIVIAASDESGRRPPGAVEDRTGRRVASQPKPDTP